MTGQQRADTIRACVRSFTTHEWVDYHLPPGSVVLDPDEVAAIQAYMRYVNALLADSNGPARERLDRAAQEYMDAWRAAHPPDRAPDWPPWESAAKGENHERITDPVTGVSMLCPVDPPGEEAR